MLFRSGYTNRVDVKTSAGRTRLTVPVRGGDGAIPRIDELVIATEHHWAARHAKTLEQSYGRSLGWPRLGPAVLDVLRSGEPRLAAMNERLIRLLLDALAIRCRVVRASELGPREERGARGLAEVCRRAGAATYVSGAGGRKYNDPAAFSALGVDLVYSAFEHPVHAQPHGAFEAGLSALDLVFSEGDGAGDVLRAGIRPPSE